MTIHRIRILCLKPRLILVIIKIEKSSIKIEDYATPEFDRLNSGILRPNITTIQFELKPVMFKTIQEMGQFGGLPSEDPHSHLK